MSLTLVLVARIPAGGIESFRAYEDAVLPLLARHGGELQRRLRTADGATEIHVVRFASAEGFAAFRSDPDRAAAQHLIEASGAVTELHEVTDV